ncbi:Heat shock protein DnaJ domain protein [Hyella patelloides LEGE 07179]|uniref:Heat shock protein DnaJ domain protein n=1 Tax=Hyella patelloides LEGE 07179 TaxID=945734 RepID=A0A563VKE8_9CYAN|nr:molecular chaperone DnaJ [Hyella patelloides]VEP11882.1 Heat shock protein DnaJ domain protein [Hyella patelloides LEGE 07179]
MNFTEIISQIKLQLEEIEQKEKANQKEQAEITQNIEQLTQNIEQLKLEIEDKYRRQSELDREALELYHRGEELKEKQAKIAKIQSFSEEFQFLQTEFQDNQDLLDTLYSSVASISNTDSHSDNNFNPENHELYSRQNDYQNNNREEQTENIIFNIEIIKAKLANAERLYQSLVAQNLEQYHTYQNLIIDGLDLIWCAVGFVAFGKESYKKMSFKYHPDRQGSEQAMQLINTAWEITQKHLKSPNDS